jgi:DNA topoisomerase-1
VANTQFDPECEDLAGLTYVTDTQPGYRRRKMRSGFRYLNTRGAPITDEATFARIRRLAIPPAWTDVWICTRADGHLQATGRDAKGRKQYRYHPLWREIRDGTKYEHTIEFGEALPKIRRRVERDLRRHGLPKEKVVATAVSLLDQSLIRVGNGEYAKNNQSYGLTTLRKKHVGVNGTSLRFEFVGKSGKLHSVTVRNRRLAHVIKQCQEIRGQELFQYLDANGERQRIDSADVNAYLREATSSDFTAKDFRTWAGTVLATHALAEYEPFETETEAKRNVVDAVKRVAAQLGNTPAVCRSCYVHPDVFDLYREGELADALQVARGSRKGLDAREASVLRLLRRERRRALTAKKAA